MRIQLALNVKDLDACEAVCEKHEKKPICQEFYFFHLKKGFKEHFKPLLFNAG